MLSKYSIVRNFTILFNLHIKVAPYAKTMQFLHVKQEPKKSRFVSMARREHNHIFSR